MIGSYQARTSGSEVDHETVTHILADDSFISQVDLLGFDDVDILRWLTARKQGRCDTC